MEELEIHRKERGEIERLTNRTFQFDKRIGEGFYSANYFLKSRAIVRKTAPGHIVEEQFFQRREEAMACGIDEAIALLQEFADHPEELRILALDDGDIVGAGEPVLKIEGRYEDFGFLESMIDGILARRSSVATNVLEVVRALRGTPCFSMADRQDDYLTQAGDGYATYVAGIRKFSTDAQGSWVGVKGMGTMPHALIEIAGGDVVKAARMYHECFPGEKVTCLIDYHNDVVRDSLRAARELGDILGGVRVDTSKSLVDHWFDGKDTSGFDPRGVCKELIYALRKELDKAGFPNVHITVSSGFTAEKIEEWTRIGVPVDMYGVGSSLIRNDTVGFTGDLVKLDGRPEAKEGRADVPSDRLRPVRLLPR